MIELTFVIQFRQNCFLHWSDMDDEKKRRFCDLKINRKLKLTGMIEVASSRFVVKVWEVASSPTRVTQVRASTRDYSREKRELTIRRQRKIIEKLTMVDSDTESKRNQIAFRQCTIVGLDPVVFNPLITPIITFSSLVRLDWFWKSRRIFNFFW